MVHGRSICCPCGAGSVDPYIDLGGLMDEARVGLNGSVDLYIDLSDLMCDTCGGLVDQWIRIL